MKKIKMFLKAAVVIGIALAFVTPGAVTVANYGKTAKVQVSVNTIVASTTHDIIYVDATTIFTIENPPVDFEVVDADPFDGFGDNGPYSTFNDALLGTLGECRSMAEFDISPFSVPPGEFISVATFEVMITEIDVFGLGVDGETPESLAVDGYVGNGLEELSDFEAGDGNVLDSVDTPDPQIGQVLSFDVTSFVTDLVNAQEQYVGLTIRAETFGGLWVTEGGVFPKLTIETIPEPNNPPYPPSNPDPPNGTMDCDIDVDLSWTCSDPDDDDLVYDVYFEADDPDPDVLVSDDQTQTTYEPGTLLYETTYYWQIIAKDEPGASTPGPIWHFTTEEGQNEPPGAPTITGETNGKKGTEYEYTFNAVDPDGDNVKYYIDWDDGDSETTDFFSSGIDVKVKHTWSTVGTYIIKATAEDTHGLVGPEGTLSVSMPRNRAIQTPFLNFLQNFLQQYPILYQLLQRFLRL